MTDLMLTDQDRKDLEMTEKAKPQAKVNLRIQIVDKDTGIDTTTNLEIYSDAGRTIRERVVQAVDGILMTMGYLGEVPQTVAVAPKSFAEIVTKVKKPYDEQQLTTPGLDGVEEIKMEDS